MRKRPAGCPAREHPLPPAAVSLARLLHPFPSLLVSGVTVALVPLADNDAGPSLMVRLGVGMLLYQFCIGVTNDVADYHADASAKPWKALPRFGIRWPGAVLALLFAVAGALVTAPLGPLPWLVGVAGLACGLGYDVWLKRTPWSWVPMSLALPLIPVWVWSATETWSATLWTVFPLGWGLGLALHLLNQSPDVPADREAGVRGLAQRLGARDARTAGLLVFALVAAAVCVELAFLSPARALAAATVAGGALALSPVATRWFGRDGLFGDVAVASAAIALLLLSAA